MVFCKDCKHYGGNDHCYNPKLGLDPVSGNVKHLLCSTVRERSFLGEPRCDPSGNWFEPKSLVQKYTETVGIVLFLIILPLAFGIYLLYTS